MSPRWLPPGHSPLPLRSLRRGVQTALSAAALREARSELDEWARNRYHSAAHRWMDSGTSALSVALRLATADRTHRRVALPAYGCYDLATACDGAGVEVLLYDVDPTTLGPDWPTLELALQKGAAAVVVVHLYGVPVDLDNVSTVAARHGAIVIEDAAQGVGGTYDGQPLGSRGDFSVLSFGRGKGLTGGGGGMLLASGGEWAARLMEVPLEPPSAGSPLLVKTLGQALLSDPTRYWLPASLPMLSLGETIYHPAHPPREMPPAAMGVLSETVREEAGEAAARIRNAARLAGGLSGDWLLGIVTGSGRGSGGYLRYPLLAATTQLRDRVVERLTRLGVSRGYPTALIDLKGFGSRVLETDPRSFAGARALAERLLTLPTHSHVRPSDIDQLLAGLAASASGS